MYPIYSQNFNNKLEAQKITWAVCGCLEPYGSGSEEVRHSHLPYALMNIPKTKKAICKSFLCKIWGHGILWLSKSEQSAKIVFFTNSWKFSPSKVSRYTVYGMEFQFSVKLCYVSEQNMVINMNGNSSSCAVVGWEFCGGWRLVSTRHKSWY